MNLAAIVHSKNKYPGGRVQAGEDYVDVYDKKGVYAVALRKNGFGQWADQGELLGARDKWCNAPIPKEARVWKLYGREDAKPRIALSEEHVERAAIAEEIAEAHGGRIPSVQELLGEKDFRKVHMEHVNGYKWERKAKKSADKSSESDEESSEEPKAAKAKTKAKKAK